MHCHFKKSAGLGYRLGLCYVFMQHFILNTLKAGQSDEMLMPGLGFTFYGRLQTGKICALTKKKISVHQYFYVYKIPTTALVVYCRLLPYLSSVWH